MERTPKHNGVFIGFWATREQAEKLEGLATASGWTKTKVLRALLDDRPIPDKGYWRTYSQLASIGGLIKGKIDSGEYGNAYKLGEEILKIARNLEKFEMGKKL